MIGHKFAVGAVALGFTLAALPVWAGQRPDGERGPRGGGGASSESRPGGASADAIGGGSSSSSTGSSSTSDGGFSAAPAPSRAVATERAARQPREQPRAQRPRSGEATGRAVPRGGTPSGGGQESTSSSSGSSDGDRATSPRERAVPYSRPRDGRTATGRITERRTPVPDRGGGSGYYRSPYPYGYYNDPYGYYGSYWYPGYALGMGYFYYDPFWYGSYGGYGSPAYGHGYGQQGYGGQYSYGEAGALRLKLKPRDAQVYVDGYFVGNVDSFDGVFQRLSIEAGAHKIEIRAPGFETLEFDVLITPGDTVTYTGELPRIQ